MVVNFGCRQYLCIVGGKYVICRVWYDNERAFLDSYNSSFYRQQSNLAQLWYLPFLVLTIISGASLVVYVWDNAEL
jgi:hypothetical protein